MATAAVAPMLKVLGRLRRSNVRRMGPLKRGLGLASLVILDCLFSRARLFRYMGALVNLIILVYRSNQGNRFQDSARGKQRQSREPLLTGHLKTQSTVKVSSRIRRISQSGRDIHPKTADRAQSEQRHE